MLNEVCIPLQRSSPRHTIEKAKHLSGEWSVARELAEDGDEQDHAEINSQESE